MPTLPEAKDPLDRAMLFDDVQQLSARLGRHGVNFGKLKTVARVMAKGAKQADLVELERAKVELEVLARRLQSRENSFREKIADLRFTVAAAVIAAVFAGAAVQKFLSGEAGAAQDTEISAADTPDESPAPSPAPPTPKPKSKRPSTQEEKRPQPHTPDFLNENHIELTGLSLLLHNNDTFDRYIFNGVTGNRQFTNTFHIGGGYPLDFGDRQFTMPYAAFLFKAFDERSNVILPKRLGRQQEGGTLAELLNAATKYRARDEAEIKTIIATSYELSFGIKIPHEHIKIEAEPNGKIAAIKYVGPHPDRLIGKTTIATRTMSNPENPERRDLAETEERAQYLVDEDGNLIFPPSVMAEQGIAIPVTALPNIQRVSYEKTFVSQGREISVRINVPIDSILAEQDKLRRKGEEQTFEFDTRQGIRMIMANLSWYVTERDPLVTKLAHEITDPFDTPREKVQAILDFLHTFHYVPDAYGEAPRTPRVSLISRGGDCEDSSIFGIALAKAVDIECIFIYMTKHATTGCDVGERVGTAIRLGDQSFEWAETTGGVSNGDEWGRIIGDRAWRVGEKPPTEYRGRRLAIEYAQKVGGPLIPVND